MGVIVQNLPQLVSNVEYTCFIHPAASFLCHRNFSLLGGKKMNEDEDNVRREEYVKKFCAYDSQSFGYEPMGRLKTLLTSCRSLWEACYTRFALTVSPLLCVE